jgi:Polyketide cyclase / dehydrase and lipid transport
MPVLTGNCSAELEFGIERCWALVADIERAPEWQRTLELVEVRERDEDGRPLICDTVSDAKLTKVRCRVRMSYEAPRRLQWTQVESDDLDSMEGSWELADLGPERTRATYSLALDPGPIGLLARPLERVIRPLVIGRQAEELAQALRSRS